MAGADKSQDVYQGLLIPDARITYRDSFTRVGTLTEAGPRPGAPVADQASELALEASGESDGTAYDVRVQVGGCPGRDDARFLWKPSDAGSQQWRGWDPPVAMSGWRVLDATIAADAYDQRHALTLASGVTLCASRYQTDSVRVWSVPLDGGAASAVTVYTLSAGYSDGPHPCLLQLPSGRVLLFFLLEVGDDSQLRMYYSDDDGDTWTMGQRSALTHAIDRTTYVIQRLRVARVGGELMMVVWVTDATLPSQDVFIQYASQDLGASWSKIDTWSGADYTTSGAHHDLVGADGAFVLAYLRDIDGTDADGTPFVRRVGNAWDPLSSAAAVEVQDATSGAVWSTLSGGVFSAFGPLTLCVDDDGTMYMLGRDVAAEDEGIILSSVDGGLTWSTIGFSQAPFAGAVWWQAGDPTLYPRDPAATCSGGRILVFHGVVGSPSYDDSLQLTQLGGHTDVEWPLRSAGSAPTNRTTWGVSYMPWDLPENVGTFWTAGTAGAPTAALSAGYLHIEQDALEQAFWYGAPAADIEHGVVVEAQLSVISGAGGYVKVTVSDGAAGHVVEVSVTETTLTVRDIERGLDLASVTMTSAEQTEVRFRIAIRNSTGSGAADDGEVKVWKRPATLTTDRDWDLVVTSSTLWSGAHVANRVSFGGVYGASVVDFGPVHVSADDTQLGVGMYAQDNPTDLQGRALAAAPVYVAGGLCLRGVDGPGFRGQTWTSTPSFDHGAELVHAEVSRSPARRWRSSDNATDETIAWTFDEDSVLPESSLLGVYLGGINFRTAELHGRIGNIYQKIADIDSAKGTALTFVRYGNSVIPNGSSGINAGWLPEHALAGWTWRQAGAGVPVYRKIVRNTAGAWGPGSHALPRLFLEGAELTDDASGTNGALWSDEALVVVNDAAQYRGFKLVIPAQGTADGYREVGVILIGRIHLFGQSPSWSRQLGWESTASITTRRNGARLVRSPASVRRRVSFSWDQPVDTSELFGSSSILPSWGLPNVGGAAAATPADTVLGMGGLFARLEGAQTPVVYLPRIEKQGASGTDFTLVDSTRMLYGSIVSTEFVADQSMGDECGNPGEMLRGGRVTIEEEL